MALRQNAIDYQHKYPQAAKAALEDFYIDDGLSGEDTVDKAIDLQGICNLYSRWDVSA